MIIPVILSGGSGTRLWPLSRESHPKQFLSLCGDDSLFQSTLQRLDGLGHCGRPLVVCNDAHRFLVAEQMRALGSEPLGILLEPVGRNTAPAVACAAHFALERDRDAVLLVMPSDHVITLPERFREGVVTGAKAAGEGALVTFGIVATKAETGYGYIRKEAGDVGDQGYYPVAEFVEKPDLDTARRYVESGIYYWNSGMFMFRADRYLEELDRHFPEILAATREACSASQRDLDFMRLDREAFSGCPAESIDYAVMEKTDRAVVVPLDAGWSDVGAWSALWEVSEQDPQGNVLVGDVLAEDVSGSYLRAEHRMLAAIGIEGLVVVETADAVLVAPKDRVQEVKRIVSRLKEGDRCEHQHHVKVFRPWGSYETVDECQRFKVKRILVKPGESLSLQLHHHRSEHWVVVKGTARITRGDQESLLTEDQSIYIPLGEKHRLENPGLIPLEIIEVQTGSYLGEDDIVRFSDHYGRDRP